MMRIASTVVSSFIPAFFLLLFSFPDCAAAQAQVKLQLKWHHQSQFAGFYVAKEKRFYQNEDLDVSFFEGGPGVDLTGALLTKKADFAICAPEDMILQKSLGNPLIAVSSIYRKSAVVFLSKKGSGIKTPLDFKNKTIAVIVERSPADFVFHFNALMRNLNVDTSGITKVKYDPLYKGFKNGTVDVTPAYFTGGLVKLKVQGLKMNIIYPADYRVRFYSDTLITRQDILEDHPDLALKFIRASLKGWKYAIENIEEATDIVLKYARIKDRNLQKQMMEASIPLVYNGEEPVGWMTGKDWTHMYQILNEQGLIPSPIKKTDELYTTTFIYKIYPDTAR